MGRISVNADAAHAFGANRHGKMIGSIADFTSFSFHAVKNLTTAEGGALTWKSIQGIDDEEIYKKLQLLSLHGQSKDALAKTQLGAWEYDVVGPWYKCNMTDIMAGIGLAQMKRYPGMLERRRKIIGKYDAALYVFYLVISLGSGQRSTFMLGILFLFIYFMYRQGLNPEEVWVTRKMIFLGVLSLPLLAVFGSFYSIWREGGDLATMNMAKGFIEFFYDQGVTSNVMKRAYIYKDQIPSNQIYVLEFLHSGILARLLGIPVYHGNNIEHAMYGGSFTHTLGYVVMGNAYLAGRGTGTCYISELYQDMGYVGILLGNIIYAYLIAKIANKQDDKTLFLSSVRFMIITQLLWAPRGSFTGFITQNIAPTTLVVFVMVFILKSFWGLIIGNISAALMNAIILTILSKWKPKFYYKISILKEMFGYSFWSLCEALANWTIFWIDTFIVGRMFTEYQLGLYKNSASMVQSIVI